MHRTYSPKAILLPSFPVDNSKNPRSKSSLSLLKQTKRGGGEIQRERERYLVGIMGADVTATMDRSLVFTYGTLKRGFSNHGLIQDMIRSGDAAFVGVARTAGRVPLVCGPYRVPFLLNFPGAGERVLGELYAVSSRGIARMDELEGTCRGHYERLPISVVLPRRRSQGDEEEEEEEEEDGDDVVEAEAYYAHRSYAAELWRRNGELGFASYSEKEARGYVKRKDRPQDTTFLDQIRIFVGSPP